MTDRLDRWMDDLSTTLDITAGLVERGEDAWRRDPALPLAFEALANRVGELVKRLIAAEPDAFADLIWRQAARNRDFVVHHYDRVDRRALWLTVSVGFPELRSALVEVRRMKN